MSWKWILPIFLLAVLALPVVAQNGVGLKQHSGSSSHAVPTRKIVFIDSSSCSKSESTAPEFASALQGWGRPEPGRADELTTINGLNDANYSLRHPNNLANLEALLNVFANGLQLVGLVYGLVVLIKGIVRVSVRSIFRGVAIMAAGAAFPGFINWVVCILRDSNLIG